MAARILEGRREAKKILDALSVKVRRLPRQPLLATIQVGRRPDATLYLRLKSQAAAKIGIAVEHHRLPATTTQSRLEKLITTLNQRRDVSGILLQLPLPPKLDTDKAVASLAPSKDVDGFTSRAKVLSPTIAGVLHLVALAQPPKISEVVILGHDSVFTTMLANQLRHHHVAILSPKDIASPIVKRANIIITASGRGPRLTARHIQPGAILIDVGIRRHAGKTVGDIKASAQKKSKAYSPVPGGVGPLTVAFVLKNTVSLAI